MKHCQAYFCIYQSFLINIKNSTHLAKRGENLNKKELNIFVSVSSPIPYWATQAVCRRVGMTIYIKEKKLV